MPSKINKKGIDWIKKVLRFSDYLSVAQIYLKEDVFLEKDLSEKHLKSRPLGHFGTVPGLNFIYTNINYLINKYSFDCLFVTGPGHGAPAILSQLFLEETLNKYYPKRFPYNKKGADKICHDFSWPGSGFPSHVTPGVPGSILEGGELGYSLSTAFGSILDNPNLITVAVVGDGEAESGPTAAAWHSNKFINPKVDGAVLPILHINHYKISNPTIYGMMSHEELNNYFSGLGYNPIIIDIKMKTKVEDAILEMNNALEKAYGEIKKIQKKARIKGADNKFKVNWPMIALKSPKGWRGLKTDGKTQVEGTFHSHGVPINPWKGKQQFDELKEWLESYNVKELLDKNSNPSKELQEFLPSKKYRMGMSEYANAGGKYAKKLKIPALGKYSVKFKERKTKELSRMKEGSKLIRDIIKANPKSFRFFSPDEVCSNLMDSVFEVTNRPLMWPIKKTDEHYAREGRVMEILSEHTIQGWMSAYALTGRYGIFASYEAFLTIINSMVDQHVKFIKQAEKRKWRNPASPMVYILTSVGWRQEHNGFSHQNPSFVSNVLQKNGKYCQVYYPVDVNSMLVALEESLSRKNTVNVIVAGKRPQGQYLTLSEAKKQAKTGIAVWDWVTTKSDNKSPDVVMASCGDYMTKEALAAVDLCKDYLPEMKIRFVNVSEVTAIGLGDYGTKHLKKKLEQKKFDETFTKDKPVIFNYHGYKTDIEHLVFGKDHVERFSIHGYQEEGSTTTPFDLLMRNGVSRYDLAIDAIEKAAMKNKKLSRKAKLALAKLAEDVADTKAFILENGEDPEYLA